MEKTKGGDVRLDAFIHKLKQQLATPDNKEHIARRITEALALTMQGALPVQRAPAATADAFCASRLDREWGGAFGTLGANARVDEVIGRGLGGVLAGLWCAVGLTNSRHHRSGTSKADS